MEILAKYIHGSEDSTDIDTYYIVDKVPSFAESKAFCDSIKAENANLLEISNGHVVACYKGTPDECNNSLYSTYWLHKQDYPLLVSGLIIRDVWLKVIRAVRIVLSHMSRTQYRKVVKAALKSQTMGERINTLRNIDFSSVDYDTLEHNQSGKDVLKVIAFQLGQTLSLINGKELYSKSTVAKEFPELKDFLYRKDNVDLSIINKYVNILCDIIISEIKFDENRQVALHYMNRLYDIKTEKRI